MRRGHQLERTQNCVVDEGGSLSHLVGTVVLGFVFGKESSQLKLKCMFDDREIGEVYLECFGQTCVVVLIVIGVRLQRPKWLKIKRTQIIVIKF